MCTLIYPGFLCESDVLSDGLGEVLAAPAGLPHHDPGEDGEAHGEAPGVQTDHRLPVVAAGQGEAGEGWGDVPSSPSVGYSKEMHL